MQIQKAVPDAGNIGEQNFVATANNTESPKTAQVISFAPADTQRVHTPAQTLSSDAQFDAVPEELRKQNLMWREEIDKNGEPTKVPYHPRGFKIDATDPANWSDLSTCLKALESGNFSGPGFSFKSGGGIVGIDLDHCFTSDGQFEPWAEPIIAAAMDAGTYIERSPNDGVHIFGLGELPFKSGSEKKWPKPGIKHRQGIEVYDRKRYFTVTGRTLRDGTAPEKLTNCQGLLDLINQTFFADQAVKSTAATGRVYRGGTQRVSDALEHIDPDAHGYAVWLAIGMSLKDAGFDCDVWDSWSQKGSKYQEGECAQKWKSFNGRGTTLGTLFWHARLNGWRPRIQYNDVGNGERFVSEFGNRICWSPAFKAFLVYDAMRWRTDDREAVLSCAKQTVRQLHKDAAGCDDDDARKRATTWANLSSSSQKLKAMVEVARDDLAVTIDMLDRDQFKLNCANGTIDLRSGSLLPHSAEDFITKLAPVNYIPTATCPRFIKFLSETFGGDQDLIDYVQCVLGYSLTGSVSEQKLCVWYGTGRNGKSTLANVVREIMGDYAQEADPDLLVSKRPGGASPDVARLKGCRFATAIETNEDVRLDEAKVKQLTGGDTLTARLLHANPFSFDPTHKLTMVTNYKPRIRSTNTAMWRRISLIPFEVEIPESSKDVDLPDKLRAEYEGILAWMVEGCARWQLLGGLIEPNKVKNATNDYKASEDGLETFIQLFCRIDPAGAVAAARLHERYANWCADNGEQILNMHAFKNRMQEKGFAQKSTNKANVWRGLTLIDEGQG